MANKMKLKKQIESKMVGEYEMTKTHIVKIELGKEMSNIILDIVDQVDDPESQYHSYGISTDFDGEIVCIYLNKLSEQLQYEIDNPDEDSNPGEYYKALMEFLNNFEGYTLWW